MFFISNAYAQQAGSAQGGSPITSLIILVAIFAFMYFFMIAPQRKRMKEHRELVAGLKKGDEVITSSGIMGRIVGIDEQAVDLEISKSVVVRFNRHFIGQVLPKGSLKTELKSSEKEPE